MRPPALVSVVIPVFNGRDFVEQALDSVAHQTIRELEILVVDDGSTDGTPSLVTSHPDSRIILLTQTNAGPSAARNHGVRHARGRYVAFLDADDLWTPHKLEDQLSALESCAEARWAYSSAITMSYQTGEKLAEHRAVHEGDILCSIMQRNCITGSASSVIVERELLLAVGGFDEALGYAEDWELWARLAAAAPVKRAERASVFLRSRDNSYGADVEKMRNDALRFIEKAFNSYAARCASVRPMATAWIHFLAGLGLRAQERRVPALRAFVRAIVRHPTWIRPYASVFAMVTPRPIRIVWKRFVGPRHVSQ